MKILKQLLIGIKVMFIVFVWMPVARAAKALWRAGFGPCCDNPKLEFTEGPGFSIHKCLSCGRTRVHQMGAGF